MNLPISVCLISKNEEKNIEKCLTALKKLACEIVVVDTGSTDATVNIAEKYADIVGHFEWISDFSAAKNYSASLASNDFILSIDCDEFLESFDPEKLLLMIGSQPDSLGTIALRSMVESSDGNGRNCVNERITRFYNRKFHSFQGAVHETLSPLFGAEDHSYIDLPLSFLHTGYESASYRSSKAKTYLDMLLKERSEKGSSAYNCYQIAKCYRSLKDNSSAAEYLSEGLSFDLNPALNYVQEMVETYGYTLLDLKRFDEALGLEAVYTSFAVRSDFVFLMGLIYMNNGLFDKALNEFEKACSFSSFSVEGTNSFKARYNMAVIYEVTGRTALAKKYYRMCSSYAPAIARLKEIG